MNDVKAPRNAQSQSPRRRRPSSQADGSDQLGELEFSDWYETPVFEPDEDELMEEAATSGHGPRRLMARMVLARDARRAVRRPQWDEAPAPPPRRPAPVPAARTEPPPRPAAKPADAETPTKPVAAIPAEPEEAAPTKPVAAIPAKRVETTPAKPAAAAAPPKPAAPAKPAPRAKPATATAGEPAVPQDRWSAWATSGPSMDEQAMQADLDRDSWRRRIDSFLDRWAAAEVAVAARLDRSIEKVLSSSEPRSLSSLLSARRDDSD